MARKKSKKKTSRSALYLTLLLCLAYVLYLFFPQVEKKVEQAKVNVEKTVAKIESQATQKKSSLPTKKAEAKRTDKVANLEIPAPLKNKPERILKRKGYTASYNKSTKQPNWVAWELTKDKLIERESRTNEFLPDPDLRESEAITTDDYKRSGYDRGHMCPAGDSKWHWKAMQESFYMTNICPQNHKLNNGDWKELEEDCRRWAKKEGSVYIVCGPIFYNQKHETIGRKQRIPVPEAFFKVVLSMKSNPPKGMGFIFKNQAGNQPLESYVNSIDQVERITGIDFFPALPDEVEKEVESKVRTF